MFRYYSFTLLILLYLMGCATQYRRESIFVGPNRATLGMNKDEFITKFGKPYKEDFFSDENKVLHETLYYNEQIYAGQWYIVNTIFRFENKKLVAQEQGKQEPMYNRRKSSKSD
ncbi:hypothetical protein [Olivibacter domesticus]|uniref:Uncharacterized protein n=1 Tax=Olivibacter domesticus TaxID=407022 RepID=A0A1H7KP43_OLID1|nr:hypothetical protein [Olivibacter domesticus]SEK88542.1 hypothetical protein SAMN05661044_01419 [Olivibacter domesticus]